MCKLRDAARGGNGNSQLVPQRTLCYCANGDTPFHFIIVINILSLSFLLRKLLAFLRNCANKSVLERLKWKEYKLSCAQLYLQLGDVHVIT